jgi:general secretion pathway protein F
MGSRVGQEAADITNWSKYSNDETEPIAMMRGCSMRYEVKALRGSEGLCAFALDALDASDAAAQALLRVTRLSRSNRSCPGVSGISRVRQIFRLCYSARNWRYWMRAWRWLKRWKRPERNRAEVKILSQVVACLYEGQTLSYALRKSKARFPPLYVAAVHASEKTGALPEALARYITYQTQMDGVRRKIVSASIYPVMLAGVGGLVMVFLMFYVVPRFSHVYADIGGDLPFMSRLLMGWGMFISDHGKALFSGVLLLIVMLIYLFTRPFIKQRLMLAFLRFKHWRSHASLSAGAILSLARDVVARWYAGGNGATDGFRPLAIVVRDQLELAGASIREGQSISQSMERNGLTTPVALRMLRVGERTGKMGEMMERIATFYEDETALGGKFHQLFEPLLMVFIGLLIGGIVVLMYFPIFELAGAFNEPRNTTASAVSMIFTLEQAELRGQQHCLRSGA